eukprot:CAMPEP_0185190618 /NCGR_PEP_ID=MMETSP1140-20130426/11062_1 /TAXON_ID=298111 /ORGANISM="Pavlova sp., Strain CCMP459" /LENGTH=659 /DNA_ID=CAMNT_0027757277 /DNA_START=28 /DNA_END=2004 /DNA_ORIENTATION=+
MRAGVTTTTLVGHEPHNPRRSTCGSGPGPGSAAIFTATPTALVIDDDLVARSRLQTLLANLGVAVTSCGSVAEGLRHLQEDIAENGCVSFTRIFCDIVMPEASGDSLLGLLTSSGWPCSIVMVTGSATEEQRSICKSLGAIAVLSKPVRRAVLQPYFVLDASADGRRVPGPPMLSTVLAMDDKRLADSLLTSTLVTEAERHHGPDHLVEPAIPAWADQELMDEAGLSKRRPVSAPRLRHSAPSMGARSQSFQPSGSSAGNDEFALFHTSAGVHSMAMGASLALAVHVQAADFGDAPEPTGQAQEDAALFEEQREDGSPVPEATAERIYRFLMVLIINNHLDMPVAIEAVIFLERAVRRSSLMITHTNWKSLLLTAIILGSKAHYDEQVWVEDFVKALRMYHLSAGELHRLEMALLRLTDYGLLVRQSTFTLYCMELASLHTSACPFCQERRSWRFREFQAASAAAATSVADGAEAVVTQASLRGRRSLGSVPIPADDEEDLDRSLSRRHPRSKSGPVDTASLRQGVQQSHGAPAGGGPGRGVPGAENADVSAHTAGAPSMSGSDSVDGASSDGDVVSGRPADVDAMDCDDLVRGMVQPHGYRRHRAHTPAATSGSVPPSAEQRRSGIWRAGAAAISRLRSSTSAGGSSGSHDGGVAALW